MKERVEYVVEKTTKIIVEKVKQREETIKQYQDQSNSIMCAQLLSFPAYLKKMNRATLSKWVILNDCVREEHPAQLPLTNLPRDDVIYAGLT